MISLKRTNLLFLISLAFLLSSCVSKNVIFYVPKDLPAKVAEANKSVCSYKGRVSVIYNDGHDDIRFKGYLDKDCEDNFRLKILGLFGSVAYDISYMDGQVKAFEKGEDVSSEMAYFMRSKGLGNMISLIRYPHVKIDDSFKVHAEGDEYILTRGIVTAAAGGDYLLRRISFGEAEKITYGYTDGKLSELTYVDGGTKVEISLR